jgi:LAGLIDADG-like domain
VTALADQARGDAEIKKILDDASTGHRTAARLINDLRGIGTTSEKSVRRYRRARMSQETLTSPYAPGTARVKPAAGGYASWHPGIDIDPDDGGEFRTVPVEVSQASPAPEPEEAALLGQFDLDPAVWEITAARKSLWQSGDEWLEARRVSFRKRGTGTAMTRADIDGIMSAYHTPLPPSSDSTSDWTQRIVMVPAGDLQLGKQEGGGTAATIDRFCRITNDIREDLSGYVGALILPWLGDCLTFDTEIVTRDGIAHIGDVAGQFVDVKDANGGWVNVQIKGYGRKPITEVVWKSRRAEKVTRTSNGHEWVLRDGTRVRAEYLKPGMSVLKGYRRNGNFPGLSQAGVQAGFIYGDGTYTGNGTRAIFCGDKDQAMLPWFPGVEVSDRDGKNQSRTAARFPASWKITPDIHEGTSYLYGWLAGYFAADGCVDSHGGARLASASRGSLEFVRSACAVLGIDTYPIREVTTHATGRYNDGKLYEISLGVRGLPGEFFLIPAHRERVRCAHSKMEQPATWVVESVEDTGTVEETFCCVVPTTQSFLLADGLLTSNCLEGITSQGSRMLTTLDIPVSEQVRVYRRLMMHQIATLAPLAGKVVIPVVPGNHDETTRVQEMPIRDSWAIEGASAVADWMSGRPEYSHVEFLFPEPDQAGVTVDVGPDGTPYVVTFIHGHTTGTRPDRIIEWWRGQAHGRLPAGRADMLVSAHYHHLRTEQTGGRRTWLQIPALDGGSEWYRRKSGEDAQSGIVTVDITPGSGTGWSNLTVRS